MSRFFRSTGLPPSRCFGTTLRSKCGYKARALLIMFLPFLLAVNSVLDYTDFGEIGDASNTKCFTEGQNSIHWACGFLFHWRHTRQHPQYSSRGQC